jgi:hypothetical protein
MVTVIGTGMREPTPTEAVERRAVVLIVVETIVVIFAALPGGLVFLSGAEAWRIGLYALGLGLGLASLGSSVLVFSPRTDPSGKVTRLFSALVLLFAALLVAAVWVFASVAVYGSELLD